MKRLGVEIRSALVEGASWWKQAFDKADIQQPRSTVTIMERGGPTARAPVPEGPPA
jgi:hypothetical protein